MAMQRFRRPWWLSNGLGFALGAFPLAKVPGLGVPVVLGLTAAIALAALTRRPDVDRVLPIEVAIVALIGVSAFSAAANIGGLMDLRLFVQWDAATSITVILLRLSRERLMQCGRWFVGGATVGAAVGLLQMFSALPAVVVRAFEILGYPASVFSSEIYATGADRGIHRLTGPFGHPNSAAVLLLVALLIAVVAYTGWLRAGLVVFLLAATGLTVSRAIGLSLIAAAIVLIVFQSRGRTARLAIGGTLLAGAAAAFAVPAVRARILGSFTSSDVGSSARWQALVDYPQVMNGHWLFGVGWGRKQFWDPTTGYITNYVANAPLVAAYRGGIVVGLAFCVVLAFALVISYRAIRSGQWDAAILGAGFIGFIVVGAELDHPIVTHPVSVSAFALLLAFVADLSRRGDDESLPALVTPGDDEDARDQARDPAGHTR
ncbi:O-antigen ligase family protein [Smaragdicoccus niigatensis]|uniref:O-antigen ligase family protein n=1 Tax=Smaragdicoccus niigatensis TaxID=359359 RepID=UPI000382CF94|nr:hypothetical protein [Smaragdicoccus niigatensis]